MFIKKTTTYLVFGLVIFFQNYTNLHASSASDSQIDASVKITSLGSVPDGFTIIDESLQYCSDMRHVTYVMINDKKENFVRYDAATSRPYYAVSAGTPFFTPQKQRHIYVTSTSKNNLFVVLDGKPGPVFDKIDALAFSPDESRLAYRAVKGDRQCVVVDNNPQPLYDGIPIKKNLAFSPDNTHLAYVTYNKETKQCAFVFDGKELNSYKFIENVVYSPDSKQYAYTALVDRQGQSESWRVVRNGQESDIYDKIFSTVFSPDSSQFAFVALRGRQMVLVVDNKETLYDRVGVPYFSSNSKHLAYAHAKSDTWHMNVDGKDGPKLDELRLFFFSPDSSQFAYFAIQKEKRYFFINHEPGPAFDKVGEFSFSPDSKRYAYGGVDEKGSRVLVDGKQYPVFTSIGEPRFSPDSRNLICKAFLPKPYAWFLIINGEKYGNDYYGIEQYLFSPDSRHVAFRALKENGKEIVVVDGKEHDIYRIVGMPFFSPDGNHIAYHALQVDKEQKENWYLVVNGRKLPEIYGGFRRGTPIIYDADNRFHTIAIRPGPEFLDVEVEIPKTWKIDSRM